MIMLPLLILLLIRCVQAQVREKEEMVYDPDMEYPEGFVLPAEKPTGNISKYATRDPKATRKTRPGETYPDDDDDDEDYTTEPEEDALEEGTTLPEEEVVKVMYQEIGTYTPMEKEFQYFNDQQKPALKRWNYFDRCYDDYIKCTINQANPTPVCAYNNDYYDGYLTSYTYCDLYFDNCRRRYRYWRILDVGYCYTYSMRTFNIFKTRKFGLYYMLSKFKPLLKYFN